MRLAHVIAGGFGTGSSPFAPGTLASLAAVMLGALLLWLSPVVLAVAALLVALAGGFAISKARVSGDPGWVVIDEVAGQWVAMLALPKVGLLGLLLAFGLFRFFDITKLGPVGWADRQEGVFGIMADDVIAGALSALLLLVVRLIFPQLLM